MAEEFLLAAEKSIDLAFKPRTCLPGDDITQHITNVTQKLRLGAGLVATCDNRVVSTNAGVLRYRPPNRYWLDFNHKRYKPALEDGVVGMIVDRNAEFYRVDIGSSSYATLGMLAFDGASKRNRPNLQPGTLVYCRVVRATKDLDACVTCEGTNCLRHSISCNSNPCSAFPFGQEGLDDWLGHLRRARGRLRAEDVHRPGKNLDSR
ncbi:hypothetical protein, variant 1 [Aphanomyces invadans]|uniref:Exosome complex exonuclease Rrp40 N-terminal domain-containing protein n=1 Tax=Aphanomyces invadans TaxID=157072 RepID=A0A024TL32_9STRA|nr:hypothetical protein, variant 1 [Aphanomyces invadans]ETV94845.1 hypothetical protein, variant 1 [Aphanomyces invadans]|eukprot:XP_008876437.1 hypothetical protein, variant 1 [Aphanomyces invadans]